MRASGRLRLTPDLDVLAWVAAVSPAVMPTHATIARMLDPRTDAFLRLQRWYRHQCDGEWEHEFGVRIDTLDNPGWSLMVDLRGTALEAATADWSKRERSEHDWLHWCIIGGRFEAFCGPMNLNEAVQAFVGLADSGSGDSERSEPRRRLRWHAGLDDRDDAAGSVSDCTASGASADGAVDDFIGTLQAFNVELNGAVPSAAVDGKPGAMPRDVAYAVAEVSRMLRDAGQDEAAWRAETAWSAVLSGDIDDVVVHVAQELRARGSG